MPDGPMIHVEGLTKAFTTGPVRTEVLRGVDLEVEAGEVAVILGPSGSGKTTLMNILGGLDRADGGQARVGGLELQGLDEAALTRYRRAHVGFVFQLYNLVPNLTVAENVELVAHISPAPLGVDAVLEAVGLLDKRDRFPRALSGGEQQRVSIARAVVRNPSVLLCDEPTGALDFRTAQGVLGLLQQVNRDFGTTLVLVTHNTAIAAMAHRVLTLREGQVVETSTRETPAPAAEILW